MGASHVHKSTSSHPGLLAGSRDGESRQIHPARAGRKTNLLRQSSPYAVEIYVFEASGLEATLSKAISMLIGRAAACKCGITLIRHSYRVFSARVDDAVPFGLTREVTK